MSKTFHGWDLSLNHAGFVGLNEADDLVWWFFVTDKAAMMKAKLPCARAPANKEDHDRQAHMIKRLMWWETQFQIILLESQPSYVGIEDYALQAQSNSVYQIGELGGTARLAVLNSKVSLRLHDPTSVKMYVAHTGNATPDEVRDAVFERWPITKKTWGHLHKDVILDLTVAFGIAKMVRDENMIRSGRLMLADLHPKEIQVFHRVTKANPVNLLTKEWITQ